MWVEALVRKKDERENTISCFFTCLSPLKKNPQIASKLPYFNHRSLSLSFPLPPRFWKPRLLWLSPLPYFQLAFTYCNPDSTPTPTGNRPAGLGLLMGISDLDFVVLFPAFTCVAILLSTTREVSPKCKLDHGNSVLKCCLGYLEPSDHMAFKVMVPFLQASLSHALCISCWSSAAVISQEAVLCILWRLGPVHWFCMWFTALLVCWWP